MRTKHFLMALALPAIFAACSDQEILSTPGTSVDGKFVQLGKGFTLVGNNENDEASTRGQWESTADGIKFVWRPSPTETKNEYAPDQIGLAWTGVSLDDNGNYNPTGSMLSAADGRVFTNYKFNHFAWKINGIEPEVDPCTGTYVSTTIKMLDGYADDVPVSLAGNYNAASGEMLYTASGDNIAFPKYSDVDTKVNASEGLFNTNNSTVYAGQYIVYSPYDKTNISNYIVASSKTNFEISKFESDATKAKAIEAYTNEIFKYGTTNILTGGNEATNFATKNLNGYVGIKLKSASTPTIKKVIIYDASGKLLTKVGLDSKGIMEGQSGKDLYLDNGKVAKEYVETVTATMGTTGVALTADKYAHIAIPMLPTEATIPSLKIVLINDANKAIEKEFKDINIARNAFANNTWLDFAGIDFTNASYLATDQTSLAAAVTALAATGGKIKILGNITLSSDLVIAANSATKPLTIEGGKIIVPDNNTQLTLTVKSGTIVKSAIDVLASCCKANAGILSVEDAELAGIVTVGTEDRSLIEPEKIGKIRFVADKKSEISGTINNYGYIEILGGTALRTSVEVSGNLNNYNALTIEKAGTATYDAKLNILGEFINDGITTVKGVLAIEGVAVNNGEIVDKISSQVTGKTAGLSTPGKYISEVDNNAARFTAALENRPTTTVRFVGSTSVTYDLGKLLGSNVVKSIDTYEIAATGVKFENSAAANATDDHTNKDIQVAIKNLVVTAIASDFSIDFKTNHALKLTVNNTVIAKFGKMTLVAQDDKDRNTLAFISNDVTIAEGGEMAFGKNVKSELTTLTVAKEKAIKGKITFDFNSITTVSGQITVNGTAEIKDATGETDGSVAGIVWYTGVDPIGNANWLGGTPTQKLN